MKKHNNIFKKSGIKTAKKRHKKGFLIDEFRRTKDRFGSLMKEYIKQTAALKECKNENTN